MLRVFRLGSALSMKRKDTAGLKVVACRSSGEFGTSTDDRLVLVTNNDDSDWFCGLVGVVFTVTVGIVR